MTSQTNFAPPPRIATWLIGLFTADEEAESISGDLLEEYSHLASRSGIRVARRWYWRQSVKSIAHLFGTGFRVAPWSTLAVVGGGFFLLRFVSGLPHTILSALTDRYLTYWSIHFKAYMFLATDGMLSAHLIAALIVGCVVALAARGRELVATVTLALVFCAMIGAALMWVATRGTVDFAWMLWSCFDPLAIVVGGAIVRTRRSAARTPPFVA